MDQMTEPLVVGVRFSKVGKIYHFAADTVTDIKVGDQVVVETSRGWQLGQVAQLIPNADPPPEGWKAIDRRATPRDLLLRQMWQMKEAEVVSNCKAKAVELNLVGIKITAAEYSFDGSRLTILFNSETEEKYDLKSLRQDMQKLFAPSQVEMRQIGPRDVAKTTCGMGACGLETRCCCLFLTEFSSISIRMAKDQGISLTPTEITGMCGRLRCCLIYEYDTYVEARSKLPKRNKRVRTPQGDGKVVDVVPLREAVIVDLPEVGYREFPGSEIQLLDADGQPIPNPNQPAGPPIVGTQQASEIDQAITGDDAKTSFVVGPGSPAQPSPWDNPPAEDQPRSMPRPGQPPQRRDRPERRDRNFQPRRDQPPGGQNKEEGPDAKQPGGQGGQPSQGGPRQGGGPGKGSQPGGKGARRQGQGRPQNRGQQPPGEQPKSGPQPGGGGQPRQRGENKGDNPPRGGRDSRKKRGQHRDSNDTETGA